MVCSAMYKLNGIPNSARCKELVLKCSSKNKEITYRHKDWLDRKVHRDVSSLEEESNQVVQALKTEHGRAWFTLKKDLQTAPSRSAAQNRTGLQKISSTFLDNAEKICKKHWRDLHTSPSTSVDKTALICIQHTEKICRQHRTDMQITASRSTDNTDHICIQHCPDTLTTPSRSSHKTKKICIQHWADLQTTTSRSADNSKQIYR